MKVMHLWLDYSPNLFDRSHPLCLAHGLDSEVVCQAFIANGAAMLPHTHSLRQRSPAESNATDLITRVRRRLRRPVDAWRFGRLVHDRVAAARPQVAHVHFGTTAATLQRLGALPELPLVVSFYGADVSEALHDTETLEAYRAVFLQAHRLHVLCDAARDRLVAAGCPPDRIVIANLPATVERFPDIGVSFSGRARFLVPARFVEKKGHAVLLAAFARLVRDGSDALLTCYGYGPSAWLVEAVAAAGLYERVQVVDNGQTGDFASAYERVLRDHDIVLAPSIRSRNGDDEGGPALTLVMAQAAGKPVIVSDFPGAERSVDDGVEGLVVPAGDVDALHAAMACLAAAPDRWQPMGQAGRKRVLADFSEATYWSSLRDWYRV